MEIPQVGDEGGNNGAQEVNRIPAPQGEKPQEPVVVSELDRVKAENLHLKLLIAAYKVKDAQTELAKYTEEQRNYQTAIIEAQNELQEKYGIDLETHEILPDGRVIPRGQSGMDFAKLMQRIASQQGGQAGT